MDIVFCGTFAAWRLGTIQARALPLAQELGRQGIRCAVVTTPWDMPSEAGVADALDGVALYNASTAPRSTLEAPVAILEQHRIIRSLSPRAVHVFKPRGFGGFAGMTLWNRLPVLVDSDDWEGDGGWNRVGSYSLVHRRVFDWQERTMIRQAHGVTAASSLLFHRARALRCTLRGGERRVLRLPNALPVAWHAALASAPRQRTPVSPTLVLYSRFAEFSRDWVPRFLAALERDYPAGLHVRVIGAEGLGVWSGRLCLDQLGYVTRYYLPELLATSSIAVVPHDDTLVGRAKHSVKLLELMAAGCAIITSDVGDAAEMTGPSSVLLRSNEPEAMAGAVVQLLGSPTTIDRLSRAARSRVRDSYLIPDTALRLLRWYHDIGVTA